MKPMKNIRITIILTYLFVISRVNATVYYIDDISGNDNNVGTSSTLAWQSLSKINSTTFLPGDSILFKAGGTWSGQLLPLGSGSLGHPIVVGMYGSGNKPLITGAGAVDYVVWLKNQDYWEINNLEITNPSTSEGNRLGVRISAADGNTHRHVFLKGLEVHDVMGYYTFATSGKNTGGIGIRIAGGGSSTRFDSIIIENCEIYNVVRVGISTNSSQSGDLDRTGDQPITNLIIRNNSIHHTAGDGLIVRIAYKPIIEHNVAYENHNGNEGQVSYGVALWCRSTDTAIFQYNEVYNTRGSLDGEAFDADFASVGSVFQYNYSHDNEGGFLLSMNGTTGTIVRYNISQNDGAKGGHVVNFSEYDPGGNPVRGAASIYNNTFYISSNTVFSDHAMANTKYSNNIIYRAVNGTLQTSSGGQTAVWDHNCVFGSTSLPSDPALITSDPKLGDPGSGDLGMNTVDGYKLLSGSPAINSGVLISNNGGKDYFNNSVSSTLSPNIGAYNGSPVQTTYVLNGVNELFEIYPNPASNFLKVKLSGSDKVLLNIYSLAGVKVFAARINSNDIVDISSLEDGLYLAEVRYNDVIESKSIYIIK